MCVVGNNEKITQSWDKQIRRNPGEVGGGKN